MTLIIIWAGILSFAIIMYVILDGFDLGIGILLPWIRDHEQRGIMISTVAPVWDGNETWLVFGAASLYAAFPLAYSTLLPILYTPIMIMLAALIFRGVTFEFRFKAHKNHLLWDISFATSSIIAAFMQGVILGTFIQGYHGGLFTPFSIMTGIAVVVGYALLGSTWLIAKTSGELQNKMYRAAKILLLKVSFFLVLVSIWTPLMEPRVMERWFSMPNLFYLAPLPILTAIVILYNFYALKKRYEFLPFCFSIALFIFAYIGFCISAWPYIIPHTIPFWEAASAPSSLKFMLVGVTILLPVLLGYTVYSYRVFRGKVTKVEHY